MSRKMRWNPVVLVVAIIFVGYWAVAIFVIAVDPLRLYPWGVEVTVSPAVSPQQKPELIVAETSDPNTDLIVIGSSVSAFYSQDDFRQWLPGVKHPVNLSYFLPGYEDNKAVLSLAEKNPNAKRVILFYHHATYLQSPGETRAGMPMYALDQNRLNDLRAVNFESLILAIEAIRHQPLYAGTAYFSDLVALQEKKFQAFQTTAQMISLANDIDETRAELSSQTASSDCNKYPGLTQQIEPFAHTMSSKGVELDIVMPVLSHAYYGQWLHDFRRDARFQSFFARDLALRRCIVNRLSKIPHVNIFAFEDSWIVDDMANFTDPGHLHSVAASKYIFSKMRGDRYKLTPDNIEYYLDKFRAAIVNYDVRDSDLLFPHGAKKIGQAIR
ncbi:MAG: putative TonB-dependent receptor protein [Bradyrhizobium sp.]|nr:putative TonB-dependent receptor protein [Bradyrhizobium sp.]